MPGVSIRPSDFIEGGAVPVDKNLLWKECRFALFDYTKKDGTIVATTCAARITYVDDDKNEYVQHYSAADPERFVPSEDGKTLVAVGSAQSLAKSSNFYLLMNALLNCGAPESKLGEDISVLDGLYTYNIGLPEPKRAGLARQAQAGEEERQRVISIPSKILKAPWDKGVKGAVKSVAKAASAATVASADTAAQSGDDETADAITAKTVEFVGKHLGADGSVTRQKLATAILKDLAKDPDRDAIAGFVYSPGFHVAMLANGYKVAGETVSKA